MNTIVQPIMKPAPVLVPGPHNQNVPQPGNPANLPNPGGGQGALANPIIFPQRSSFQDFLPGIQENLNQVAPQVQSVPGLDQSFYDSLFESSKKKLNDEFFGNTGLFAKNTENLNSRGLLGSSLEIDSRNALNKDFASQLSEVQSDINRAQQESVFKEALERRQLEQQRNLALAELGLRSSLTESAESNKFGIGQFEQQVNLEEIIRDQEDKRRQQLLDLLTSPDVSLDGGQQNSIIESLFPDVTSGYSGASGNEFFPIQNPGDEFFPVKTTANTGTGTFPSKFKNDFVKQLIL